MKKIYTLCIVQQNEKVLLGLKKLGLGTGFWNGFGGRVKEGETIEAAARRELYEEAGVEAGGLEKLGVIDFKLADIPEILQVHIFRALDFEGEPKESNEMTPQWFDIKNIPFGQMWPDDHYWLPLFLEGKKFKGEFSYDKSNNIIGHQISEV